MSAMTKKEIQQLTADPDLKMISRETAKESKNVNSSDQDFRIKDRIWQKINLGIVSRTFLRFVIILVSSISLLELERTL